MNNDILIASIGFAGVAVGAILAGATAWFNSRFQLRYQETRDRKKLFLDKLQELYEVVSRFKDAYSSTTIEQIKTLTASQPLTPPDRSVPAEKLQMLIGFYAPTLRPQLGELIASTEKYTNILVESVGMHRASEAERKRQLGLVYRADSELTKKAEQMQMAIVDLSKQYI